MKNEIYFSKQGFFSNMCALHAVNNLMGDQLFSQKQFDEICSMMERQTRSMGLNIKNRHIIGGDYDANVILKAVQNYGFITKWIDSRKKYHYEYQEGTAPKGYIINIRQKKNLLKKFLQLSDRHWICLKLYKLQWYILDSKNQEVELINDIDLYLNTLLQNGSEVIEIRVKIDRKKEEQNKANVTIKQQSKQQFKDKQVVEEDKFEQLYDKSQYETNVNLSMIAKQQKRSIINETYANEIQNSEQSSSQVSQKLQQLKLQSQQEQKPQETINLIVKKQQDTHNCQ